MKLHSIVDQKISQKLAQKLATKRSAKVGHERVLKALRYDSQEELFFACTSFILLLIVATADVLVRTH